MQVVRVSTANGIDDIRLLGETELERQFIKQIAGAGTLSCISRQVANSVLFRAISVASTIGSSSSSADNDIGKYDFSVRQNQDSNISFTFIIGETPIGLTSYDDIKLQVKQTKEGSALLSLTLGSGLEISGVDRNVMKMTFTADQTRQLTCESYYYDILMTKENSNIYYIEGKITVKKSSTR